MIRRGGLCKTLSCHSTLILDEKRIKTALFQTPRMHPLQSSNIGDFYVGLPKGWRTPFQVATRMAGRFFFGGQFLIARGWK